VETQKKIENFLAQNKIGLILRTYAIKKDDVPKRVKMLDEIVNKATSVRFGSKQAIKKIDILVWKDEKKYPGQTDCGKLTPTLREHFGSTKHVRVWTIDRGDIFCATLNKGIAIQSQAGCRYSVIASAEANSYWNQETIGRMILAAANGAKAIGVALNELQESILEGRIANTFAMWHNMSLLTVGGFDLRASKPINDKTAHYMRGWKEEFGEVYYHLAGVEEMIPLARMADLYGECIAPIMPFSEGKDQVYQIPTDPDLLKTYLKKMGTKLERQITFLTMEGVDTSFLKGGVMEDYRHSSVF
jgi:hypothetical protein